MGTVRCDNCGFTVSDEDGVCFVCGASLHSPKVMPKPDEDSKVQRNKLNENNNDDDNQIHGIEDTMEIGLVFGEASSRPVIQPIFESDENRR